MVIPIRHENMSARRWPVVTIALVAINIAVFGITYRSIQEQNEQLTPVKNHLLMLAAMHPELEVPQEVQAFITKFRERNPDTWKVLENPNRRLEDAWDARIRLLDTTAPMQEEMDSLASEYVRLTASSVVERYAFFPSAPKPLAYLTATFLHGGWLHLISNMWFLWLAGFVLEDKWGRILYPLFYLVAGAAALQVHAWMNSGSIAATLGASGAVAALMGAFLIRFPKVNIEILLIMGFRLFRFKAPAYTLLPFWVLMEVFDGLLWGQYSAVAHWAHVGGFAFGALAGVVMRYSGLERKAEALVEAKVDPKNEAVVQANELAAQGQIDPAIALLKQHLVAQPDAVDACMLLQELCFQKNDIDACREATLKLCELHVRARDSETAFQYYKVFLNTGGSKLPASLWLNLCRLAEDKQEFERALEEYKKLAAAYPAQRESLQAQLGAGKICLKRLNRFEDALRYYEAASASPVPHLDWEQNIAIGIRDAKVALSPQLSSK
jgi:membrane associated rhomboid family serine protease